MLRTPIERSPAIWVAVALALIAAASYLLIAQQLLGIGDLEQSEKPATVVYVAAACYLAGGLLILTRRDWLWVFGAVVNAMVILFFFRMYQNRPSVMLSPGGLATKIAQILLEVVLVALLIRDWRRARQAER